MGMAARIILSAGLAFAGACTDRASNDGQRNSAQSRTRPPVVGYRDLRLGASFNEAIALAARFLNPAGLARCVDDLPIWGMSSDQRERGT